MGAPRALALCRCFGGALEFQTGRWAEAAAALDEAVRLYREVGSASGESLSLQRLGVLLTAQGDLERARQVIDEGIVVAERAAMRSHCLTRLHASMTRNRLAADDLEVARTSLEAGLVTARRHGHCVTCNALLLPEAVRLEVTAGNVERADEHAAQLERIATRFDSRAWTAMASHARGRVHAARGAWREACEAFEQARAAFIAVDQLYEAARCQLGWAEAARRAGPALAAHADGARSEAHAAFARLGAPGVEA
jgi:tetratricopeptide (TPR) repeat protein